MTDDLREAVAGWLFTRGGQARRTWERASEPQRDIWLSQADDLLAVIAEHASTPEKVVMEREEHRAADQCWHEAVQRRVDAITGRNGAPITERPGGGAVGDVPPLSLECAHCGHQRGDHPNDGPCRVVSATGAEADRCPRFFPRCRCGRHEAAAGRFREDCPVHSVERTQR